MAALTARRRAGMLDETFGAVMDWGLGVMVNSWHYAGKPTPYGYGDHAGRDAFGHGGRQSSLVFADPEHGLSVAFAANGMPGEAGKPPSHPARHLCAVRGFGHRPTNLEGHMTRSRALLTVPIVLAIVIIGVFAIRSRGGNDPELRTTNDSQDCPPVARADAVATKPATPISIDVLANDTDPDGDPLVFQILRRSGGESTIDDGGTPTDASDDRVLFTPADPAPAEARIEYQALDPQGAVSESIVNVSINEQGALAPGESSDTVTETAGDGSGRCAGGVGSTSTSGPGTTITRDPHYRRLLDGNHDEIGLGKFKKKKSGGGSTTRTTRTTQAPTATTQRTTTTRAPTTTTPTTQPTTTQPTGPPPTTPPSCGEFPVNGTDEQQDDWRDCVRNGGREPTEKFSHASLAASLILASVLSTIVSSFSGSVRAAKSVNCDSRNTRHNTSS